jgi:hypothetical protein
MKKSTTDSTSYQMSSVPVTITEVTPRWRITLHLLLSIKLRERNDGGGKQRTSC